MQIGAGGYNPGITGPPAPAMFMGTFAECSGLTGEIPNDLFAGLTPDTPAQVNMFADTFSYCTGLTGPSARIPVTEPDGTVEKKYLYEIWPDTPPHTRAHNLTGLHTTNDTYYNDIHLSDYDTMPDNWKLMTY